MSTETKTPTEMTDQELEQLLKSRKKEKAQKAERERKAYEKNRDESIHFILNFAKRVHEDMQELKRICEFKMEEQAEALNSYGEMRSNSKGGFSITNSEDDQRITRRRDTQPRWDERSIKAQGLIKDFLGETIKKRDKDTYEMLMSFLEKNEKGELEYARVMILLQHENRFQDERWVEGLRLIKESYSNHLKGFGYELKEKTAQGKWEYINLSFASL